MNETPATETPATETPATETPATETPATETPASAPGARTGTVQVPVWALAGFVALVLVVGAFLVGRTTAPTGDSGPKTLAQAVEMTASGEMEVGQFDVRTLLEALSQNKDLDLGPIGNRILDQLERR